uniref:hypothetical protein n=1 Tax=Roseomonas rosulenta TaxID=2748667 RepID=UPI001E47284D
LGQAPGGRAMILGMLFLLGAVALVVLAWRGLRRAGGDEWVRATGTRIVIEVPPGQQAPRLRLESDGAVTFGPVAAEWAPRPALSQALGNAEATPGRAGGAAATGSWRVVAMLDLAAPETFGTGDAALERRLAESLGGSAMLLERVGGGAAPMLLHGIASHTDGSIGGIALTAARFGELAARIGNPEALAVEVLRRRVQRTGWGGERAKRRRAG